MHHLSFCESNTSAHRLSAAAGKSLRATVLLAATLLVALIMLSSCTKSPDSTVSDKHESNDTAAAPVAAAEHAASTHDSPYVYFVIPQDNASVTNPVRVLFGLDGMGVAPAGVRKDGTGHHHLLIDVDELPPLDLPLPSTANILHFGNGQTQTFIELPPGKHTLQLLLGNFAHVPHAKPLLSDKITINVVAPVE